MAEKLHERIDADIRGGELSGIGMPATVYQSWPCIWPSTLERSLDARLQRATRDSFTISTDQ